jgi:hypothetical protein
VRTGLLLLCAVAVLAAWFLLRPAVTHSPANPPENDAASSPRTNTSNARVNLPPGTNQQASAALSTTNPIGALPAALAPLPPELSSLPPETILENLQTTFHQYAAAFGGNPVGTNPEITRALQGENPKQIDFLKVDGNRVNSNGELVDPWGTPYFFHQLSGKQMEIRSAGPDGKMWTADDLVNK